jgi:hypothetical protein
MGAYDPTLRQTPHGEKLYTAWRRVRHNPHSVEWDEFPAFHDWAMENDYNLGDWLRLIDPEKPYGPENCVWYSPVRKPLPPEWADEWNRTVNRIRKHYGMPPLEGTNYGDF